MEEHQSDIYHIMSGDGSDSTDGKISVRVWSKCSVDAMLKLVQDGKLDCLKGPGHQSTTGRCGNGIIDPGEGCDCGALDCSSVDACCDGTTCQLATGATCAPTEIGAGGDKSVEAPRSCCDAATCAPAAAGTVCRAAIDATCDAPEVCDGATSSCPADAPAVARRGAVPDAGKDHRLRFAALEAIHRRHRDGRPQPLPGGSGDGLGGLC